MTDYLHGHHATVINSHARRTVANSAAFLLPYLRAGMSLLDVGCGPGSVTLDLAELLTPGRVVGVDVAQAALSTAAAGAVERADQRTAFARADVYDLPFPDNAFDVVYAHQVLQHLGDPVPALREMARVCRPGGVVAVRDVDYQTMTWYPDSAGLQAWLSVYRQVARELGGQPDAGRRLRGWVQQAGLEEIASSASVWCYATVEDCRWWGESQAERVTESRFAARACVSGVSGADLDAMSAAWRHWAVRPDAWFAMTHGEVVATVA